MGPKKRERLQQVEEPKVPYDHVQSDHELFLQAFESKFFCNLFATGNACNCLSRCEGSEGGGACSVGCIFLQMSTRLPWKHKWKDKLDIRAQ